MHTSNAFGFAAALLCALGHGASLRADEPPPRVLEHIHADGDFIDDPFALSADGRRIAWITTDGATRAELHVMNVGDTNTKKTFAYGSITPERVEFLDSDRVLVVDRNPQTRFARAEVFGPKGSLGRFGPATDVGLGTVGGVPALVTWLKTTSGKGSTHTFVAWRRDSLKALAKKVLSENSEGRVQFAGSLYKPLYFVDGFATLVGQKEGAYDKAHDIRRPDVAARADLFGSKLIEEKEIGDVVAYAEFTNLRKKHMNESSFVRFSDDRSQLELIDPADAVAVLAVPRPLRKYDAETLLYRPTPDGNLTVSLTVDPVNPEAVKAQKADKDWLDVYHLDVKSRTLTPLVRIDGEKRPTTWWVAGSRLALLRKHKGFGRGGSGLDVLELGTEKKPEPKAGAKSPAATGAAKETPATANPPVVKPAGEATGGSASDGKHR